MRASIYYFTINDNMLSIIVSDVQVTQTSRNTHIIYSIYTYGNYRYIINNIQLLAAPQLAGLINYDVTRIP